MGVKIPHDDYKTGDEIKFDSTTYFGEASFSISQDPDKIENIGKNELKDLPIAQESFALLVENTDEVNTKGAIIHNIHLVESYVYMSGMDPELVLHHLLGIKTYKRKLKKMNPHITLKVQNLSHVGFIRLIDYG